MLSRNFGLSIAGLVFLGLTATPASAAIINWQYAGTVSANGSHYGGVNVGDAVTMTVTVDTAAVDAYGSGSGASLEPCGLYSVPTVTVSFGGLVYQSWSPTMTINTPGAAGNCGYGPSQDGYVLAGSASTSEPGSLPWRLYAEIRDVPVSDHLPLSAPLGTGVFLDLAYGFMPPSGALFSMTANLTSAGVRSLPAAAVPEPATVSLAVIGLASFGARQLARRRARR